MNNNACISTITQPLSRHPDCDPPSAAVLPHGPGEEQERGLPQEPGKERHRRIMKECDTNAVFFFFLGIHIELNALLSVTFLRNTLSNLLAFLRLFFVLQTRLRN